MTGRRPQKVRFARPPRDAAPEDISPPSDLPYGEVRPALLPPRLKDLNLSAQTKPGVRGFPAVDDAQALLAQTMRKDRVSGDVLDLTAMGGLLAGLPGVRRTAGYRPDGARFLRDVARVLDENLIERSRFVRAR